MKLEIKNLSVDIQGDPILKNLSLTVNEGEFLSLLGPSGCGKSTLLKTIAGILPATKGQLFLGEQELTTLPIHRRGAVIVFQDMRLFPHMSVVDNVAFPLKMQGVSKEERRKIAEELLGKVQMATYGQRRISEISGGQQQRVALARALAARPKLLLLDEPFSALDENLREEMRNLVMDLHREFGMTTILVTHDREEALSMSDRVIVMFDGQIAQCGSPQEVYAHPSCRRVADYFGDCVYLPGLVKDGVFTSAFLSFPCKQPNGKYELLLRWQALHPEQPGDYELTVRSLHFHGAETLVSFEAEDGSIWKKACREPGWAIGQRISCYLDCSNPVFLPE